MPAYTARTLICIALSGIAGQFLGHANTVWQFPLLALLFPLALTLLGYHAPTRGQAFRYGMLTAIPALALGLSWLRVPMEEQLGLEWYLSMPTPLLLSAVLAVFYGTYSLLAHYAQHIFSPADRLRRAVFLGCSWGALEFLRGVLFTGFPWMVLPAAFAPWAAVLQPLSLVGSYAYSGVLATIVVLLTEAMAAFQFTVSGKNNTISDPEVNALPDATDDTEPAITSAPLSSSTRNAKNVFAPLAITAMLIALCTGWSVYAMNTPLTMPVAFKDSSSAEPLSGTQADSPSEPPRITLAMVQGNIDQGVKWNPIYQSGTVDRYVSMSKVAQTRLTRKGKHADLIIWPETAMPFYMQENTQYRKDVRQLAITGDTAYVVGAPAYKAGTNGRDFDVYNRAYMLLPSGLFSSYYDKEHLVPFGEYLPMGLDIPLLQGFFEGSGAFLPGKSAEPLTYRNLALGMLICYEAIFPELARERVAQGANLLVNISNDAWFGKTAAPLQHLHLAMLRAVEQGRYLIRSTNTGISAIVDDKGRITAHGGIFRAEVISGQATLLTGTTPFFMLAPYLHALLICIPAALFFAAQRKRQ